MSSIEVMDIQTVTLDCVLLISFRCDVLIFPASLEDVVSHFELTIIDVVTVL